MISFQQFVLENGLRVFVHEDSTVEIAVVNILYDVGSRDEEPNKTGFAHLFEHLMFGGSMNIPSYDEPLQRVGGENNAFTNTDITNYYLTVPATNLETGFWLESDRMLSLSFDPNVLEVQRKVVIEEFKQRYLNQPYGDVWLKLRPLAYQTHPYQWATIGKEISHIEGATMDDVRSFFFTHYAPNNAILTVAGNVKMDHVKRLAEKWFGPIPMREKKQRNLPQEARQTSKRTLTVEAEVPATALYKTYHTVGRFHNDFHATDLLSDAIGRGHSSRLYQRLVQGQELFTSLGSFTMGTIDPGLMVVSGRLKPDVTIEQAEDALNREINQVLAQGISEAELEKVKSLAESTIQFDEVEVMNRAVNLSFAALSGNPDLVNEEVNRMRSVSRDDLTRVAADVLRETNSSVLYYQAKKN
ncbi:MAG: M16 family metallopeptidase [Cyclobacteriaceae bacterium]